MSLTLAELYASPDHYLHSFENGAARFVPMDRAAYHRSIFLDGRISAAADGEMHVPFDALANVPPALPTSWIFHVAHCGSTLLARALDRADGNLVLREPLALRQIAVARDMRAFSLVSRMVSKRYRADRPTLVKANVPVNFILPEIVAAEPGARAIFLYLELDDYVRAILRSDTHRDWLRRVTTLLADRLGQAPLRSDAQRAAALWLGQMQAFAAALAALPNGRTLNAERFFAAPGPTIRAAADLLDVRLSDQEIATSVGGPLFGSYAKNPSVPFDNQARLERRAALEAALAPEIAEAQSLVSSAPGAATVHAAITGASLII